MFFRLALRNVKRQAKNALIYFLTISFIVALLFFRVQYDLQRKHTYSCQRRPVSRRADWIDRIHQRNRCLRIELCHFLPAKATQAGIWDISDPGHDTQKHLCPFSLRDHSYMPGCAGAGVTAGPVRLSRFLRRRDANPGYGIRSCSLFCEGIGVKHMPHSRNFPTRLPDFMDLSAAGEHL